MRKLGVVLGVLLVFSMVLPMAGRGAIDLYGADESGAQRKRARRGRQKMPKRRQQLPKRLSRRRTTLRITTRFTR